MRSIAFVDADQLSPRNLISLVQNHCAHCCERGRVTELAQLTNERQGPEQLPSEPPGGEEATTADTPSDPDLDRRFNQLVREADVADALDEKKVDDGLPALLRAGLTAWAEENAAAGDFSVDPPPGRNPPLHARQRPRRLMLWHVPRLLQRWRPLDHPGLPHRRRRPHRPRFLHRPRFPRRRGAPRRPGRPGRPAQPARSRFSSASRKARVDA